MAARGKMRKLLEGEDEETLTEVGASPLTLLVVEPVENLV